MTVATALLGASVVMPSCNKDDFVETQDKPSISLDSPTGVYTVKAGRTLTIAPSYSNSIGASYLWEDDEGRVLSRDPQLVFVSETIGSYYITVTVTTSSGSASEELRIDVVGLQTPAISFPFAGDEIMVELGTEFVVTPEIANSDAEGFEVRWTVDGIYSGDEATFRFMAEATGEYKVEIEVRNIDGEAAEAFILKVVEELPFELSFPTPSYLSSSTDRFTFPGRGILLRPHMSRLEGNTFVWSIDGRRTDCDVSDFMFTPAEPGTYTIGLTVDGKASATVRVTCVDASEDSRMRRITAVSSPRSNRVYEWIPAPGQFIGDTKTGGMSGTETTHEAARAWAEARLSATQYVSLGAFGGYIVVGFDHSIAATGADFDFAIGGNAFLNASNGAGGSNEPGIVYVMQDVNGNGLPDDEWYELRGSESGNVTTMTDYAVTYYRPAASGMNVQWTDNRGNTGTVDYLPAFHSQDYYYPAWIEADSYTLRGTCLHDKTSQDNATGFWDNSAFAWGYADNMGSDTLQGGATIDGEGHRNGFSIVNSMYADGTPVALKYIDFVKVQTGVNSKSGWLGEVSTEVFSFSDLSLE